MNKDLLKKISSNKILHYIFSRYFTSLVQFLNSILIAIYLGPFYLGVWGFINLVTQYFTQMDFGITVSFNVLGSVNKSEKKFVSDIFNSTLSLFCILSAVAILVFIVNQAFSINIGGKYDFSIYAIPVCIIIVLSNFNALFSNLFRIYGNITEIAISQSCFPVLMLITIILFSKSNLLWALVFTNVISLVISVSIFALRSPVKIKPIFDKKLFKIILTKAIYLFVYTTAFDFIIISVRSFISGYYSVSEFGYFTFAFLMANAIMMLLDSLSFLILPKFINKLAHIVNAEAQSLIEKLRSDYIIASYFLVYLAICLIPIFFHFFPKYEPSLKVFRISALAIVLNTHCFGFQALLFARNKERLLGAISIFTLILNISICFFMQEKLHVPFYAMILAIIFSYNIFSLLTVYFGRKLLDMSNNFIPLMKCLFPVRLLVPYVVCICFIFKDGAWYTFLAPLALFIILNIKPIWKLKAALSSIIHSPDLIKI